MLSADEIRNYNFFSDLSEHAIDEIAKRVDTVVLPAGAEIIRQNTPPDYFYFVKNGSVEITKRNTFGQIAKITVLESGEGFGETALLTCSHRQNTVTAQTEVTLHRLSKKDFEEVVMADSTFKNLMEHRARDYAAYNSVKTLQPLALLQPEKMIALSDRFLEKSFPAGETIIRQGEKGEHYYIIKKGRVSVRKRPKGDGETPETEVDTLNSGEGFGEEALIRDQKRSATVVAMEETLLLALNRNDFNQILKSSFLEFTFPEDISEEERRRYVFIDARIPPEYEEEHIEGAVNIPLEVLRHKFQELDPQQEYIAYCTNDSRGMAAAFLLATQGFRAKNLRSGLSGWDGPVVHGSDGVHYPA